MAMTIEHYQREVEHIGDTEGCKDHDHDMVHELSRRLDALWRYDQYIANAEGMTTLQEFWRHVKQQELENIHQLKQLLAEHVKAECF
jgi:hypothetical protein